MGNLKSPLPPRRVLLRSGLAIIPAALAVSLLRAQDATDLSDVIPDADSPPPRLPNGQLQTDAILRADYKLNVKDARQLTQLAKSIELEFDKEDQNILSLGLLKKLDDVEKITKRIRGRVRR